MALVDAIAAVIILGVALTMILSLTGQAISTQRLGEEKQKAAMYADEMLSLVLARGVDDYAKSFPTRGVFDPPDTAYEYQLEFTPQGDDAPTRVKVTVSWPGVGSEKRTVSIETLMAGHGVPVNQLDRQPEQPVERLP